MINILDEMKTDFLVYAAEVNNNRAFPDARDGLKVSQRAVLWEMFSKDYKSSKPHVKSAKVAGGTIATWHPHSDAAAYETIVRMSQAWVNNMRAVDFHGANGSVLGGPQAASSRYTECRLSKSSEACYFANIKKNVVDFIDNFSEDEKWPSVFPSIAPILMINGSSGIGYTIAQDWLPHNLSDLAEKVKEYVSTSSINADGFFPDFPTGGIIVNKNEIADIYKTGRGRVVLRGRAEIEDNFIRITELPYQVYAEPFIQKIKDLVNAGTLAGIEDIYNKSDDSGMLIEIECSADPNIVLAKLYKLTELQSTFSANQMALVNGIPTMLTLKDYIEVYVNHNLEVLKREYAYDLNKASQRLEIVTGLIKATSILDDIIKEIRQSKSSTVAAESLKTKFNFTAAQAQAITDMRLGKLANTEIAELEKEQAQLNKTIEACTKVLNSDKLQKKEFLRRLEAFVNEYGWARRTEVVDIDLTTEKATVAKKVKIIENYTVMLDDTGNLKRILTSQYKPNKKAKYQAIEIAEDRKLLLISNKGLMYKLPVKQIPKAGVNSTGTAVNKLLELQNNESIIRIFNGLENESNVFFITKNGLAKKTRYEEISSLSKNIGATVMKVLDNDEIIFCDTLESAKIPVLYNGKEKIVDTDKFITKSRTAGGVVAVKVKPGSTVSIAAN
jgi:DNA gyrase subunit A